MLLGKLDNASTHQMCQVLIDMTYLVPEISIILFAFRYNASLMSVACDTSKQFLPKAGYPSTTSNELGGEDRTFKRLDRTHRDVFVDIQVYCTYPGLCVSGDLFLDFARTLDIKSCGIFIL
jgi:hypothetical protein